MEGRSEGEKRDQVPAKSRIPPISHRGIHDFLKPKRNPEIARLSALSRPHSKRSDQQAASCSFKAR